MCSTVANFLRLMAFLTNMTAILNCTMQNNDTTLNKQTTHSKAVMNLKNLLRLLYNTSRMKQVLILRYKSMKCSKNYEYINGKKRSKITYFFLDQNFSRRDIRHFNIFKSFLETLNSSICLPRTRIAREK